MPHLEIRPITPSHPLAVPLAEGGVRAGFPSPAQDYMELSIDLNHTLVQHPATTFCAKVTGDSMRDANVYEGDILVIDRSLRPSDGDMAVCWIDGDFTLKFIQLDPVNNCLWLCPANPGYPRIKVSPEQSFLVWGVVTYTIHKRK